MFSNLNDVEKFFVMLSHMFTEPICDINVPWELPVPIWLLGLMVLNDLLRGGISNMKELLWLITQLIIVSRMELLLMAMIIPILLGKYSTWCKSPEYLYGLAIFFVRLSYIIMNVVMQIRRLSPKCMKLLKKAIKY